MKTSPWDRGLQNERTQLAWSRTTLAYLAATLVVARLLMPVHLGLAAVVALSAVAAVTGLFATSAKTYRLRNDALHAGTPIGDGRRHLLLTALVIVLGVGGLILAIHPG